MKKIFYILIAALFCAMACRRESDFDFGKNTTMVAPAPGTLVPVEFGVQFPDLAPETRAAMGEAVQISKIYIAIFSEDNGYLQNWIPTTFVKAENTEPGMKVTYTYKAYLPLTDNKVFHFIADPPIEQPTFDYEHDFIQTMVTTDSEGAYWQRIIIDGGVQPLMEDGEYVLVNGNYTVDPSSITDMQHVVLVRNFAKINVASGEPSRFSITKFALVNVPESGTVAPWNRKTTGTGEETHVIGFDNPYTEIKDYLPESQGGEGRHELGAFYRTLTNKTDAGYLGYSGVMPPDVSFDSDLPTSFKQLTDSDPGLYMYERPLPTIEQEPTTILLQIHWEMDDYPGKAILKTPDQWYKIEILDNLGEYMPILRNIVYSFTLSGLEDYGYKSASEAYSHNAFGNVSSSLETSMLNELIVEDTKLVVDRLDQSFYNQETEGVIEFQYWPTLTGTSAAPVFDSYTHPTDASKSVTIKIYAKQVEGYENAPAVKNFTTLSGVDDIETDQSGAQWGLIPFELEQPLSDGGMRKSIIRVQAQLGQKPPIYREVMITVMGKQNFADGTPTEIEIDDDADQDVIIPIWLPAGLGSSMFPIQVAIEAENNCLSTTESVLPVQDGESIFTEEESRDKAGKNTFYYVRTIQYKDYKPLGATEETREFECKFKTTKTSDNSTQIKLMDLTGKYNSKIITLTAN